MILVLFVSMATVLLCASFIQDYMRMQLMPRLTHCQSTRAEQPFISVLIPVRNEARNIAHCLDGALNQQYPFYEVIVVDDHSTDATPAILAHYTALDQRLRLVQCNQLPAGWTGKCHACQQAAMAAQGAWLLFLDADTIPQPALLSRLITYVQQQQLDMLSLFPFLELGSFWERLVMPPFIALIHAIFPFERLNAPDVRPDEVVANGQCILVRRSAYEYIGGHQAVSDEVLEDVRLAQSLRRAGFRTGAAEGHQDLRVRMYTSGHEVFEGLTKNAVAGYRSGGDRSFWAGMRQFMLAFGPFDLLFLGLVLLVFRGDVVAWAIVLHGIAALLVALSFWSWLLHTMYHVPRSYALLWPVGVLCYSIIALHSIWRVQSGRGVIWKGRTYVGKQ